jgi:predicted protein tyrosine phosphatase
MRAAKTAQLHCVEIGAVQNVGGSALAISPEIAAAQQQRIAQDAVRPRHTRILPLQSVASQSAAAMAELRILQLHLQFDGVSRAK